MKSKLIEPRKFMVPPKRLKYLEQILLNDALEALDYLLKCTTPETPLERQWFNLVAEKLNNLHLLFPLVPKTKKDNK